MATSLGKQFTTLLAGLVKRMKDNGLEECKSFKELGLCFENTLLKAMKEAKEKEQILMERSVEKNSY